MTQSCQDVMWMEFLELDLEEATEILEDATELYREVLRNHILHHGLRFEEADDRLRKYRRELKWLKDYHQLLVKCPHYSLDDVRSQLRRSLNRLQDIFEFPVCAAANPL